MHFQWFGDRFVRRWPMENAAFSMNFWWSILFNAKSHECVLCVGTDRGPFADCLPKLINTVGFVYMPRLSMINWWKFRCSTNLSMVIDSPGFATSINVKIVKINWGPFFVIFDWIKTILPAFSMDIWPVFGVFQTIIVGNFGFSVFFMNMVNGLCNRNGWTRRHVIVRFESFWWFYWVFRRFFRLFIGGIIWRESMWNRWICGFRWLFDVSGGFRGSVWPNRQSATRFSIHF